MSDAGEFAHDLFDCSSGYGIRPLIPEPGRLVWSETADDAQDDMEDHVELRGRGLLQRTLHSGLLASDFLKATGLEEKVDLIIAEADPHAKFSTAP
jgi:hypothetical protein